MPVLQVQSKQGTGGAQETNSIVEMTFGEFFSFTTNTFRYDTGHLHWLHLNGVTNENRFNNWIDGISL
jgi:hypothetical protein